MDKSALPQSLTGDNSPEGLVLSELPDFVQRYLNGESIQDIAKDHQVAARTIYRWMMSELGDNYQQAVTNVLVDRIAEADQMLMTAPDACQIARAREIARFARMDFERRRPHLYGQQKQQIAITGDNVQVNLVSYAQQSTAALPDNTSSTEDADSK